MSPTLINCLIAAAMLLVSAPAAPQDTAAERGRIEAEIQRLNSGFAAEEAACKQRFVVTACVEDVHLRRRDTLGRLRSQLLALDDAERQRRAGARRAAIEHKRQTQRAPVPEPPPLPAEPGIKRPPLMASAPLVVLRRDEAAAARQQAASAAAAQRVAAARRRQQQADEDAARVRERLLERERSGRSAAPLPVPATPR